MRERRVLTPDKRAKQLRAEVSTLDRASKILQREFGTNPKRADELGYALFKGTRELRRELFVLEKSFAAKVK